MKNHKTQQGKQYHVDNIFALSENCAFAHALSLDAFRYFITGELSHKESEICNLYKVRYTDCKGVACSVMLQAERALFDAEFSFKAMSQSEFDEFIEKLDAELYKTLATEKAISLLLADRYAPWSHNGARALICYLQDLAEELGEEFELDLTAIRGAYTEYFSAVEALAENTGDNVEDEDEAIERLLEETTVIQFKGGVIIQDF